MSGLADVFFHRFEQPHLEDKHFKGRIERFGFSQTHALGHQPLVAYLILETVPGVFKLRAQDIGIYGMTQPGDIVSFTINSDGLLVDFQNLTLDEQHPYGV